MARINIPAGAQGGHQFRLRGKGYAHVRSTQRGDMYIEINVGRRPASPPSRRTAQGIREGRQDSPSPKASSSKVKEMFGGDS